MIRPTVRRISAFLFLGALVLAGCSKDEEPAASRADIGAGADLLRYIPADTPYAFASLAPMPDDVLDTLEPKIDKVLVSYQAVLREVVAAKLAEASEEELAAEDRARAEAFVEELTTLMSIDGMRDAGIARDSMGAFYGNGLLPVFRIQLSDTQLFEATIARLEERAGNQLAVATIQDQDYRYFDADDVRIVLATVGDHAVFTLVPSGFDETQTGQMLGLELPDESLADTGVIEGLIEKYSLAGYGLGFVDLPAVAERFVGEPRGADAALMTMLDHNSSDVSDICKSEIREFAGIMPRMVAGISSVSVNRFDSSLIVELREDLAKGLMPLATPVPGLGGDRGGLMSFGFSLDVMAAREFVEERLDAMEADPYECEHFADIQDGVAGMRESLNQPVPPMVYDFKGFIAVIDEIEGLDIENQVPPESIDGSFLLAMDNAQNLVNLGALFSPELAAMNLQPDGKPMALDMPQVQTTGMEAFAALTASALSISVGNDAESQVVAMLEQDPADPPPFMSFSMDASRYYSFMGEAVALAEDEEMEASTPEMKEALNKMMQSIAELYDRMSGDVLFTENGVELNMTETLKD